MWEPNKFLKIFLFVVSLLALIFAFSHASTTTRTTTSKTTTTTKKTTSTTIIYPLHVNLNVKPTALKRGQWTTIVAKWSGGKPPYTAMLYSNSSKSCSGQASVGYWFITPSQTYYRNPTYPGVYYCEVITDSIGNIAKSAIIHVTVTWIP